MGMIQDFQKADRERRHEVAGLAKEADAFVRDLAKGSAQRRSDVATMVSDLAKGSAQRASDVKTMKGELARGDAERASEVATMCSEADAFVKDLAKGSAQRRSDVATMVSEFAKGDAERRSEVAAIHEMVWGVAPPRKVVAPPRAAAPPRVAPPVEAVVEEAPVGGLRDRVFAYLADHPDGTRLTELEAEFGLSRIEMARVVRGLIDDNKVEKRELLYFAI